MFSLWKQLTNIIFNFFYFLNTPFKNLLTKKYFLKCINYNDNKNYS